MILKRKINNTTLNIVANLMSFGITFIISFFLTPYITSHVGMEAYGLVGLANNFTSYVTIITAALNSMASRFIIIQLHKGNNEEANQYFNSALLANTAFALLTIFVSVFMALRIEKIINVSEALVEDARITFIVAFISFSLSLVLSVFSVGYYTTNRLYVGAFKTVQNECIRAILLVIIFNFIGVKIQYALIATLISSLYGYTYAVYFSHKNLPQLKISLEYFDFKKIWEMITSGIWNSISKLSQVLLNGLDLMITNLFIGGSILGSVSVAKTFSTIIISLIGSVSDVFLPKFLKAYSKDEHELQKEFIKSTKVLGFFSCMLIGTFMVYSKDFYSIWLPGEDAVLLRNLSCISLFSVAVSGSVYSMFSVYTVINKVKPQAMSNLIMSVMSTITVFILLKFTNLGVYAIVGTSAVYGAVKNLTYNMYCLKKYAKLNISIIYRTILKNMFVMAVVMGVSALVKSAFKIDNFIVLIGSALITAVIGSLIYFILAIDIKTKKELILYIKNKGAKLLKK